MAQFPNTLKQAIEWLSTFGKDSDGGVTRTLYSKTWREAQDALKKWMEGRGFHTYYDSIGNLFGRLPSDDAEAPTILVGSHVDTVKSGGKYDGAYGVIAGVLAINHLYEKFGKPKMNLEVVSLCEEEGSRFPIACWGSGMMTGVYSLNDVVGLMDSEGVNFLDAMKESGFHCQNYSLRNNLHAFIELHIEQGPSLEKLDKEIGIVQTIVGQKRFRITVKGETNHAGTTLMKWRKDPLHGAVKMILSLYEASMQYDDNLVATVGQLFVAPNVPNVIPGQVDFTIDARHPVESTLIHFYERFSREFFLLGKELGLEVELSKWHEVLPVQMDSKLNDKVLNICCEKGISYHVMNSGAGHDAQLFTRICPAAIIFVPSRAGISHSPFEYTSHQDLETGLKVLTQLLYELAY
nr:Zn-dependent hydrolase [Neobacillus sp. Marseille-Q6967]